jgi:hypothetical protein
MVLTRKCPYRDNDLVCGPRMEWVEWMLHDIGITDDDVDKGVQKAVNKYIAQLVEIENVGGLNMEDLKIMVNTFWTGYEQALVDSGLLKGRDDEELHSKE